MEGVARSTIVTSNGVQSNALDGIRVLELANLYAGPLAGMLLGDFGATVYKIEHPRGDDARRWGKASHGIPLWWKVISRNKDLVCLDLNQEGDRSVVRRLASTVDVVIEAFRPGRMEAWGLGYEALRRENPGLVMLRVSGFGQDGPYSERPGFGTLAEAFSGFASMTGQEDGPPTLPPFGLADGVAGVFGAFAVLAALRWRDGLGSGMGQVIDLSLYEPLFSILGPQVVEYTQLGVVQKRQGNRSPRTAPRNAYVTSDGEWVVVSAGTQQIADRIFAAIGRPELSKDPRFTTGPLRSANADAIDAILTDWFLSHTLTEVLAKFWQCEAPIAPVYRVDQIVRDPQYLARRSIVEVDDEDLGSLWLQGVVPKLSRTPGRIRHTGRLEVGRDTERVLTDVLGLSPSEVVEFLARRRDGELG